MSSPSTPQGNKFQFRLYIAGAKPQSARAVTNLRRICDQHLPDGYDLEVIDIYQEPDQAAADQILAVPALVKRSPAPRLKLVGDLSDENRVLGALGIHSHSRALHRGEE